MTHISLPYDILPNVLVEWVAILLRFREVVGSNASSEIAFMWIVSDLQENWDSSVGTQIRLWAVQTTNWIRFQVEARDISLPHSVQTGFGAHPASHPVDTVTCFPELRRPKRKGGR
jgi:hypothetical protein